MYCVYEKKENNPVLCFIVVLLFIDYFPWFMTLKLGGLRAKLEAVDGNEIDTVFIDRRNNTAYPNGNTLVSFCPVLACSFVLFL